MSNIFYCCNRELINVKQDPFGLIRSDIKVFKLGKLRPKTNLYHCGTCENSWVDISDIYEVQQVQEGYWREFITINDKKIELNDLPSATKTMILKQLLDNNELVFKGLDDFVETEEFTSDNVMALYLVGVRLFKFGR